MTQVVLEVMKEKYLILRRKTQTFFYPALLDVCQQSNNDRNRKIPFISRDRSITENDED